MSRNEGPRLCRVASRPVWYIYDRRRRISTGCTDRGEAEKALLAYLSDARTATAAEGLGGVLDGYIQNRREERTPGLDRLEWALKPLSAFWSGRPVEAVTVEGCRKYAASRAKQGVKPSTARTELEALRAALRWAQRARVVPDAPAVWLPPKPPPRDRWLSREEAARLIDGARMPHIRLFIMIGLHTAARKTAILTLPWARVDLDARRINFRDPGRAETRKRRPIVPINETLHAALIEAKERATTEWVIEWAGGPVASVKTGFREACNRASVTGVSPHVLRHTAATWMAQAGLPLWQIAGMLGNTEQVVQETYGHHHPDYLKDAANALG